MLTPDELRSILDQHRWRPGEREQTLIDIADRAQQANAIATQATPEPTHRTLPPPVVKERPAQAVPADWQGWIDRRIGAAVAAHARAMSGAVADIIGEQADAADATIKQLQEQVADLTARLDDAERRSAPGKLSVVG